jgi:hypothetical protein
MKGFLTVLLLAGLLTSCVTLTHERSARQQVSVQDAPEVAYQKTLRATMTMGGYVASQDATKRAVSARLNKAVIVNVTLTPEGTGTRLDVQATAEPGYVLFHDVPEDVQAFFTTYRQQ